MKDLSITELQAYIFRCMREIELLMNSKAEAIRILEEKEKAEK